MARRWVYGAAVGEAMGELAIFLPGLLPILLGCAYATGLWQDEVRLHTLANRATRIITYEGGETRNGDAAIAALARRAGLDPSALRVTVASTAGAGRTHPLGQGGVADWPPCPRDGSRRLAVTLSYAAIPAVPVPRLRPWLLYAHASGVAADLGINTTTIPPDLSASTPQGRGQGTTPSYP